MGDTRLIPGSLQGFWQWLIVKPTEFSHLTELDLATISIYTVVWIEEHQVGDLVFAQVHYLYILLEATSAYVIIPIAKVLRTKYSSY